MYKSYSVTQCQYLSIYVTGMRKNKSSNSNISVKNCRYMRLLQVVMEIV